MVAITEDRRHVNSTVDVLEVRLGETAVGTLTRLENDANIFAFTPAYAEDLKRPTLSLGYKGNAGTLVESTRFTKVKLPPFFSNLLPEGHLREYLASKGGVHPEREFFLLWLLGADLPGAVHITANDGALPPRDEAEEEQTTAQRGEQPLRFSLAGVQLKFSALMETDGGLTVPIAGVGGDWIAKLPSPRFKTVPENEFAMMSLAAAVGIDVPDIRLVPTNEIENLPDLPEAFGHTFAIRRFDRAESGRRIHIEDFAQVFNLYPHEKYKKASYGNIAKVLWLETGEAGITEFVRRLAFNVLIGNGDAHLKNWSLIYPDGRTTMLAPAYDLVSTVAYMADESFGLSIAGTKNFREIDSERFRRFAETAGLPVRLVVKTASETAQAVRDHWSTHEPLRILPDNIREAIATHIEKIRL